MGLAIHLFVSQHSAQQQLVCFRPIIILKKRFTTKYYDALDSAGAVTLQSLISKCGIQPTLEAWPIRNFKTRAVTSELRDYSCLSILTSRQLFESPTNRSDFDRGDCK